MTDTYDASHITVLEGLAPVRERPAMYIGSTDTRGLHHLVYEVVDNSIDEALAGFCDLIQVMIGTDGSCTVIDNGRGIPVDRMQKNGKSALEIVLTVLHAGGKFDKDSYQVSGGLHGVGVSVVNALARVLFARVDPGRQYLRDGVLAGGGDLPDQKAGGEPAGTESPVHGRDGCEPETSAATRQEFQAALSTRMTGTQITFLPDDQIFETVDFDYDVLAHRLRELAFLNSNVTIRISDARSGDADSFSYAGGTSEYVRYPEYRPDPGTPGCDPPPPVRTREPARGRGRDPVYDGIHGAGLLVC